MTTKNQQLTNMRNRYGKRISSPEIRSEIASELWLARKERIVQKIAGIVCDRIEFPRGTKKRPGNRAKHFIGKTETTTGKRVALSKLKANVSLTLHRAVELSDWDREDVASITRNHLVSLFQGRKWNEINRETWKAIFSEVRSLLQINRHWNAGAKVTLRNEIVSLDAILSEHVTLPASLVSQLEEDAETVRENREAFEAGVQAQLSYAIQCCEHARDNDKSRKREATFRAMVDFATLASNYALSTPEATGRSGMPRNLVHYYANKFRTYVDKGEWFLKRELERVRELGEATAQLLNDKRDSELMQAVGE